MGETEPLEIKVMRGGERRGTNGGKKERQINVDIKNRVIAKSRA